jgi:response regulator RpfG family c-di-GMP phosphodiesterase
MSSIEIPITMPALRDKLFRIAKENIESNNEIQYLMGYLEKFQAKDEETARHSVRVCEKSMDIAGSLYYSKRTAMYCGELHDAGKLSDEIPGELLRLTDRCPTSEEMVLIRKHTTLGHKMLFNEKHYFSSTSALYHHRFIKGYPEVLPELIFPTSATPKLVDDYMKFARIVALADTYCAAKDRKNFYGGQFRANFRTPAEVKEIVLKENHDVTALIETLYVKGIFE